MYQLQPAIRSDVSMPLSSQQQQQQMAHQYRPLGLPPPACQHLPHPTAPVRPRNAFLHQGSLVSSQPRLTGAAHRVMAQQQPHQQTQPHQHQTRPQPHHHPPMSAGGHPQPPPYDPPPYQSIARQRNNREEQARGNMQPQPSLHYQQQQKVQHDHDSDPIVSQQRPSAFSAFSRHPQPIRSGFERLHVVGDGTTQRSCDSMEVEPSMTQESSFSKSSRRSRGTHLSVSVRSKSPSRSIDLDLHLVAEQASTTPTNEQQQQQQQQVVHSPSRAANLPIVHLNVFSPPRQQLSQRQQQHCDLHRGGEMRSGSHPSMTLADDGDDFLDDNDQCLLHYAPPTPSRVPLEASASPPESTRAPQVRKLKTKQKSVTYSPPSLKLPLRSVEGVLSRPGHLLTKQTNMNSLSEFVTSINSKVVQNKRARDEQNRSHQQQAPQQSSQQHLEVQGLHIDFDPDVEEIVRPRSASSAFNKAKIPRASIDNSSARHQSQQKSTAEQVPREPPLQQRQPEQLQLSSELRQKKRKSSAIMREAKAAFEARRDIAQQLEDSPSASTQGTEMVIASARNNILPAASTRTTRSDIAAMKERQKQLKSQKQLQKVEEHKQHMMMSDIDTHETGESQLAHPPPSAGDDEDDDAADKSPLQKKRRKRDFRRVISSPSESDVSPSNKLEQYIHPTKQNRQAEKSMSNSLATSVTSRGTNIDDTKMMDSGDGVTYARKTSSTSVSASKRAKAKKLPLDPRPKRQPAAISGSTKHLLSSRSDFHRNAPLDDQDPKVRIRSNRFLHEDESATKAMHDPIRSLFHFDCESETLYEDEEKAGFTETTVGLSSNSIQSMSLECYRAMCQSNLSDSTQHALRACSQRQVNAPWYWPLGNEKQKELAEGASQYAQVSRVKNGASGVLQSRIIARQLIKKETIIGLMGGRLMEAVQHESHEGHSSCLFISHKAIVWSGYHGPDLILCFDKHANFATSIRPPADAIKEIDDNDLMIVAARNSKRMKPVPQQGNHLVNVKPVVCVDRTHGLLYVLILAVKMIPKGHELLIVRSLNEYSSEDHFRLIRSGRECHHAHARSVQCEKAILRDVIAKQLTQDENMEPTEEQIDQAIAGRTCAQRANLLRAVVPPSRGASTSYTVRTTLQFDVPYVVSTVRQSRPLALDSIFQTSQVFHIKTSFLSRSCIKRESELAKRMARLPNRIPRDFITHNQKTRVIVDQQQLKHVLKYGYDSRLVEVAEERSLHSPVRLLTIPSQPACKVIAKTILHKGCWLFTYAGSVCEEGGQDPHSEYVYNIPAADVRGQIEGYDLPDLLVDAKRYGSIARYMNDNRYREFTFKDQEKGINVESRWMYFDGMVHLVFYSTRLIRKGEEIITHYGDQYWERTNPTLHEFHKSFLNQTLQYNIQLEEICRERNIALPDQPDVAIEQSDEFSTFVDKLVPYTRRKIDITNKHDENDDDDADDDEEIQPIKLITRRLIDGEWHYFAVHDPESVYYGCWYKRHELSEDLELQVDAFDAECEQQGDKQKSARQYYEQVQNVTGSKPPKPQTVKITDDERFAADLAVSSPSEDEDDEEYQLESEEEEEEEGTSASNSDEDDEDD